MRNILILFLSIISFACSSHPEKSSMKKLSGYKETAASQFGENTEFLFNSDSTFVVIINQAKRTNLDPAPVIKYIIFDLNQDKIVFKDSLAKASIKWKTNSLVEILITPGIIPKAGIEFNTGYSYDITTQEKKMIINPNNGYK